MLFGGVKSLGSCFLPAGGNDDYVAFHNLASVEIEVVQNKIDENPRTDDYPFPDYCYECAQDSEGGSGCPREGNGRNKIVCETFFLQRKQERVRTVNHSSKRVL